MRRRDRATTAETCGEMTLEDVSEERNITTIASSAIGVVALNATGEMMMADTMSEDENEPVALIAGVTAAETEVGTAIAGTTGMTGTADGERTRSSVIGFTNIAWGKRASCYGPNGCAC